MTLTRILALSVLLTLVPPLHAQSVSPLEANRAVVQAFIEAVYLRDDLEAAETYLSEHYLERSPIPPEPEPEPELEPEAASEPAPEVRFTLEHLIAEGDWVTSLLRVDEPGYPPYYFIDIFRLEGGLIVEHWDSTEPQPTSSAPLTPSSFKGKPSNFRKPRTR